VARARCEQLPRELGGYHATDDVGATTLELCATTCGAISTDKELLLHPACGQ